MAHGDADAGQLTPRSTFYDRGRFGRLFPTLPPFSADVPLIRDALTELGAPEGPMDAQDDLSDPVTLITDPAKSAHNPDDPSLTAGFTFLGQFLDHLERAGESTITVAAALDWARLPAGGDSNWWAYRLSAVRGFATYLHALDPAHEVPAADLLPHRPRRASPYLYSDAEITALIVAQRHGIAQPADYSVPVWVVA